MSTSERILSRREIAVEFLSNISLDGDDNGTSTIPKSEEKCSSGNNHDEYLSRECDKKTILTSEENLMEPVVEEINISKYLAFDSRTVSFIPFRDRTNTGSSECGKYWELKQRKRLGNQPSLCEDSPQPHYFSSSESIPSSRNRGESIDSRVSKLREVRVVQPSSLQHCKNERMMLLTPKTKIPFYVFSFIPYKKPPKSKQDSKKEVTGRRRNLSGSRPLSSFVDVLDPILFLLPDKHSDDQMISYSQLLTPSKNLNKYHKCCCNADYYPEIDRKPHVVSRCMSVDFSYSPKYHSTVSYSPSSSELKGGGEWDDMKLGIQIQYNPYLLDDPEFITGGHRTVITFTTYRTSLIDYVKCSDLKRSVNEQFREKFPHIQLTLSKLRSLKRDMKKITKLETGIDLFTVAQAHVYFEKLILKGFITKNNRKICAAICLVVSAKMNDTKGSSLKSLFEKLESVFRLNHKDILASELPVLVALEFSLHLPAWEILPHFQRLFHEC